MCKIMLILNPYSGKMKAKNSLFEIIDIFTSHGYEVTVFPTKKRLDATNIVKTKSQNFDMVVCCGGDGTLNEVIAGLMEATIRKPLGYIPTGTTNDFATSLNIPKQITKAVMNIVQGKPFDIDIGMFNESYFTYSASFGMFTEVPYSTPQELKNVFGHLAYLLEGTKSIIEIPNFKLKVEYEGNVIEDDFVFGAVLNSTSLAGIIRFPPEKVKLDDGLLEVLLIKNPFNIHKLSNILIELTRQEYDKEFVNFFSIAQIKITGESDISWCLDGESGGRIKEAKLENQSKSISILGSF